jgi:curved DNA-binding protein CbpA
MNPYKILGIHKNYTLDELKNRYKIVAKKAHPDRGGNQQLFTIVTLCYQKLHEEFKLKQIDKQFNDLKIDFNNYTDTQNNKQRRNSKIPDYKHKQNSTTQKNDFKDVFNDVYDKHKIENPFDNGYGDMMLDSKTTREDIDINRKINNMKQFNTVFESEPLNNYNKKIIEYKEPEALPSSIKSLSYSELGIDNIKDFSTSSNNLECSDYKKAHSMNRLADHRLMSNRKKFNNINDIEADRSNISYIMTNEDLIKETRRKKKELKLQQRRILKQQELDNISGKNFEKINKLMISYKN